MKNKVIEASIDKITDKITTYLKFQSIFSNDVQISSSYIFSYIQIYKKRELVNKVVFIFKNFYAYLSELF